MPTVWAVMRMIQLRLAKDFDSPGWRKDAEAHSSGLLGSTNLSLMQRGSQILEDCANVML